MHARAHAIELVLCRLLRDRGGGGLLFAGLSLLQDGFGLFKCNLANCAALDIAFDPVTSGLRHGFPLSVAQEVLPELCWYYNN